MYRFEIMAAVARMGVVAIVRTTSAEDAERVARDVLAAGIDVVEVALTTPSALDVVRTVSRDLPDALVGAGTVLDAASARLAVAAGARFLVSPVVSAEVIEVGHRYGAAVLPGAQTPTELEHALALGADAVKIFPAAQLGIGWLRAIRPVFPHAPLVPTGGIAPGDVAGWLDAGAVAVGLGSALTEGAPTWLAERARVVLDAVRSASPRAPTSPGGADGPIH